MLRYATALFALVTYPAVARPLTASEISQVDQAVAKALTDTSVPSASIAIVRDGKIVLTKAYGKASETLAARPDLPYQIASNSKQFTAMALLLLEDEGKLRLDDTVSKWIPGVTEGDRITIRQLLAHTSGLQDFWPQDYSFAAMSKPTAPEGILERWAKKPLDFQPGDQWQYSNTGYVLAGMIAEKASGEPLLKYLHRKIFNRLGMRSVRDLDDTNGPDFPHGYGRYALGPVRQVTPPADGWLWAAGELSMTAEDLAKWDIARLDRTTVPAEDWEAQETTIKLNNGKDSGYGLGVFVRTEPRREVVHGGEAVGFLSTNNVYPTERAAIVVLTNSWSGDAYARIAREIAKIVLPSSSSAGTTSAQANRVRAIYDQLRSGRLDRSQLTDNANYYFTPQAIADYQSSLSRLGEPTVIDALGTPVLRGGFVKQDYSVRFPCRTLNLSTFYEPGPNGRIEQFLVSPGE